MVIHQRQLGTRFEWVGADGLYGHDYWFTQELDDLGEYFMLDIHSNQHVYISEPQLLVPEWIYRSMLTPPIGIKNTTQTDIFGAKSA